MALPDPAPPDFTAQSDNPPASSGHTFQTASNREGIEHFPLPTDLQQSRPTSRFPESIEIPGYQILDRLGRGGMGVVYLAKQIRANRLVALKLMLHGEFLSEVDRARFRIEAEAMAQMRHPNIAQVYEVNEHEGTPYLVMELCAGGNLAEFLNRKPQPPMLAAAIAEALANGIQHAHEAEFIHRDLKPGNILLACLIQGVHESSGGGVGTARTESLRIPEVRKEFTTDLLKITDFGLAKRLDEEGMTRTQAVMGTPGYMSPEQASGNTKVAGVAADIWSIGVILYEMLTGSLPFVGADSLAILEQIRNSEPIPPSERVKLPVDLETICLKCLQKEPRDRYRTAADLAADLRAFQEGVSISARPMSRLEKSIRWARKYPSWAGMIAAVTLSLILGTCVSTWQAIRANNEAQRANHESEEKEREAQRANANALKAEANASRAQEEATNARLQAKRADAQTRETAQQLAWSRMYLADVQYDDAQAELALDQLSRIAPENRHVEWSLRKRRFEGSDATLYGHQSLVNAVAWSPDGRYVVSASQDNTLRIWDAVSGEPLRILRGHLGSVLTVAWSPDGDHILSGGWDPNVHLWDARTGICLRQFKGHRGNVTCVAWHPTGRSIVSGCADKSLYVWDVKSGENLHKLSGHTSLVTSVVWSPDGKRILSGSEDQSLRVWDALEGKSLQECKGHQNKVTTVAWSPDGQRLLSGSLDKSLRMWDANTGQSTLVVRGHTAGVTSVAWGPDGRRILSTSSDRTLRIWDSESGNSIHQFQGHLDAVASGGWRSDGQRIVSGAWDHTVRLWDARTGQNFLTLRGHDGVVSSVAWSPDGKRVVSGSIDKQLRTWDARTGLLLRTLVGHRGMVTRVAWSPDGQRIASASDDQTVRVWDAETGDLLREFKGHTHVVASLAWGPDSRRVVSACNDRLVRVWDLETGDCIHELKGHSNIITCVSWSPDGKQIISGSSDGSILHWDATSGRCLDDTQQMAGYVFSFAWSPDSQRFASGGGTHDPHDTRNEIRIWDAKSGQSLKSLLGHSGWVMDLSWSSDGQRLLSTSFDSTLRIWDVRSGQSLLTLTGHQRQVTGGAWSPDGRRILSGCSDATVSIRDVDIDRTLLEYKEHTRSVSTVAWSPDGQRILSGTFLMADHVREIHLWDTTTGAALLKLQVRVPGNFRLGWSADGKSIVHSKDNKSSLVLDATSGKEIQQLEGWPDWAVITRTSPDETKFASVNKNTIQVVRWKIPTEEVDYRRAKANFDAVWCRTQIAEAEKAGDSFAGAYYQAILAEHNPGSGDHWMKAWVVGETLQSQTHLIQACSRMDRREPTNPLHLRRKVLLEFLNENEVGALATQKALQARFPEDALARFPDDLAQKSRQDLHVLFLETLPKAQ